MRIIIIAGHYGSGKTLLALNLALHLRKTCQPVVLCDLDIVNPYFRATDAAALLKEADVGLIASPWAGSAVELAGFPSEAASIFDQTEGAAVVDLGGDDRGALAMGRYARRLADYEALLVGNCYRPLTGTISALTDICCEIEAAGRFRFTGFVNNSNLGADTTAKDVLDSCAWAKSAGETLKLPQVFTAVRPELIDELIGIDTPLFPLHRHPQLPWKF